MDWIAIVNQVLLWVLPAILAYVFARLGIDADRLAQHSRLLLLAREAVLWAQDAYPDSPGQERLRQAYSAFVKALDDAKLLSKVSPERREQILRGVYQDEIGLDKLGG